MQAAGGEQGCGKHKGGRRTGGKAELYADGVDDGADQRHREAGDRRGPDRIGKPAAAKSKTGSGSRVKKTRQSAMSSSDLPGRGN